MNNSNLSSKPLAISKIALLGSGTMGSQIAAHCANAGFHTLLYGLSSDASDENSAAHAIDSLPRRKPAPLADADSAHYLTAADYQQLDLLKTCDLVIEAVSEDLTIKQELYQKVAPYLKEGSILVSNTSSIPMEQLASGLDPSLQPRFCGMHFFNPPRYMGLVELIPTTQTDPSVLFTLEEFATTRLGKHIVIAKDTAGFVANRFGLFALMSTLHHAERLNLSLDLVDELTGQLIGRPKSATFRTIDLVGIDILKNVCTYLYQELSDDPWRSVFRFPQWLDALIDKGHLGQKTGQGIYRKQSDGKIYVLDKHSGDYVARHKALADEAKQLLKNNTLDIEAAAQSSHPQGQFLYAIHRDLFHYATHHAPTTVHSLRDIDVALRWGFGWHQGIFELMQKMGWQKVCRLIEKDISNAETLNDTALASWTLDPNCRHIYRDNKVWSPARQEYTPLVQHPVYRKQLFALSFCDQPLAAQTIVENESLKLWCGDDDIAIASLKTKMHALNYQAIVALAEAIEIAEQDYQGLIVWQQQPPFCVGANLLEVLLAAKTGKLTHHSLLSRAKSMYLQVAKPDLPSLDDLPPIDAVIEKLQHTFMSLRNSRIPTVAAVQGMALGGGCELLLHCDRVVAALESYIGLVELGVGLLPAGGGCKEMAYRACLESEPSEMFARLQRYYQQIATAQVSGSAFEAQRMGYLRSSDAIVMNPYELLYVAKKHIHALNAGGYRPPQAEQRFQVAGMTAAANFKAYVANLHKGNYVSDYDRHLAGVLAEVLCAAELPAGETVPASWFLKNERHAFLQLLEQEKTQERIEYMLKNNKALRN